MNLNRHRMQETFEKHQPSLIGGDDVIETAVLIPLAETPDGNDSGLRVFFERRAQDLDIQPGDVCFPGGFKSSNDETPRETALRETAEELGISTESVDVWGEFDRMLIPWQLQINTFVGWLKEPSSIDPDSTEVDKVFSVELDRVLEQEPEEHQVEMFPRPDEDFPYEKIPGGRNYDWRPRRLPELFYEFDGEIVWGITARILNRFAGTLGTDSTFA